MPELFTCRAPTTLQCGPGCRPVVHRLISVGSRQKVAFRGTTAGGSAYGLFLDDVAAKGNTREATG